MKTERLEKVKKCSLWTAVITPFTEDQKIDYSSLKENLLMQDKAKNGLLLLGSTGESLTLSLEEKKDILKFALDLNLSVPIMVGVGGIHLPSILDWIDYLEIISVDAYLLVTPLYSKPGVHGQKEWFEALFKKITKPSMLYNVPSRTGKSLEIDAIRGLQNNLNFWGIKDASGNLDDFHSFRTKLPSIDIHSGDDSMLPFFSVMGAKGLVSVASNVWPLETKKYVELCLEGNEQKTWPAWKDAPEKLFIASNPVPVKKLMYRKGLIKAPTLRPPLTHLELKTDSELDKADKDIKKWYEEQIEVLK